MIILFRDSFICLLLSLFLLFSTADAQNKKVTIKKPTNLKISVEKPSIYISFERYGERTPLGDTETDEGIWLRLHNNIRYSIRFCSFGISAEGNRLIADDKSSQLGINYKVELTNSRLFDKTKSGIPIGYPTGGSCSFFELDAGKSILFSVPKEHLAKGLSIKIPFNYDWEDMAENNPVHYVYFNSSNLS